MKILLFGKTGQVGWELQRSLSLLGNLIAVDRNSTDYCGDFSYPVRVANTVRCVQPDIIVNAAAYTEVDKAESNIELAKLINTISVKTIAKEAEKLGSWFIHYSTDYVFPGTGETPWKETDTTNPLNVYGKTKLSGEEELQNNCTKHLIFRTSWIYASKGNNFAKKILFLAKNCREISITNDQVGAPTGAEMIADCTSYAIRIALFKPEIAGLYHLVASGTTTWYEYAKLIVTEARNAGIKIVLKDITPVPASTHITLARRPNNSRMNTEKFKKTFKIILPNWENGVKRMLDELFTISVP